MGDVTREALEYVGHLAEAAAAPQLVTLPDGRVGSTKRFEVLKTPIADPLKVSTLAAVCDYLVSRPDQLLTEELLLHVESPTVVRLYSALMPPNRDREDLLVAEAKVSKFPFGSYLDQESFITHLMTCFEPTEERAAVAVVVGKLRSGVVKTLDDDGVTQIATATSGVSRLTQVSIPNPVQLHPYRTFGEVEQPWALYLLRVRDGGNDAPPTMALHEVADQRWQLAAVAAIRDYLRATLEPLKGLENVTILA
jgi:hypothetical protein